MPDQAIKNKPHMRFNMHPASDYMGNILICVPLLSISRLISVKNKRSLTLKKPDHRGTL